MQDNALSLTYVVTDRRELTPVLKQPTHTHKNAIHHFIGLPDDNKYFLQDCSSRIFSTSFNQHI